MIDNCWMVLEPSDQEMEYKSIHRWMERSLEDHRDPRTGEINCTTLAEECALELYPGEWLSDSHLVWDVAVDIAADDEDQRKEHAREVKEAMGKPDNG